MKRILTLLIAIYAQIAYSQTSSLINDPNFKAIIKREGYSLVGSFITEKNFSPTPIAKAYLRGNWVLIDTKGKVIKEIKPQVTYGDPNYGYSNSDVVMDVPDFDRNTPYEQTSINGKYGTVHKKTGETGIAAIYDGLAYVQENILRTKLDEKYGLANANGKIIAKPQYDRVSSIIFGYTRPKRYFIEVSKDNKKGLYSNTGVLILPAAYENFEDCTGCTEKNDLIKIKNDGKWGLAKMNGKILIEPKYQSFFNLNSKGLLSMEMVINKEQKFGIMDTLGNEIIGANLLTRPSFLYKLGLIKINEGDATNPKYGLLNIQGKQILKPQYQEIKEEVQELLIIKENGKYGVVNKKGAVIIKPTFDYIDLYEDKPYALVRSAGKTGLFDLNGKAITPVVYDELIATDKLFIYKSNNEYGLLNFSGKKLKALDYDYITPSNSGILVSKNNKQGVIDSEGKVILPVKYDRIYSMRVIWEGIYNVRLNGVNYLADLYGNEVIAPN